MERGSFRTTQPCPGDLGTKIEFFVPFQRRAKPGIGIDFVAENLTNCEALEIEYVDKNGFVLSVTNTATAGSYTIEAAWEAIVGAEQGNGYLTGKMKAAIKEYKTAAAEGVGK